MREFAWSHSAFKCFACVDGDIWEVSSLPVTWPLAPRYSRSGLLMVSGRPLCLHLRREEAASWVRRVVEDAASAADRGVGGATLAAHAVRRHHVHAATVGFVRRAGQANVALLAPDWTPSDEQEITVAKNDKRDLNKGL